ncbi:hypothetical protein [Actinoplanes sp. N902-109]|uniref:hypothetical protein n=1 Tax=Actinoplanes sp. (strain N902-109) TaxID=649831 RepID=UPI00032948CF|nr:hypothetical protein [Actinoplanes sp. N902-109]AGL18957.1 hypothetical protein L083_5447 [Actinoplanes sp. N902-109]
MRWFRLGSSRRQAEHDPGQQAALLAEVRQRYGVHVQGRFADQAQAVTGLLTGDDGLAVAAEIVREVTDGAHAELQAQAADLTMRTGHRFAVDRHNYRPLWREAGDHLRWPLFQLPGGLHPYIQVAAAVTVVGRGARRIVRTTDPRPLLAQLLEVLDLTVAGWEFGRVRVDADAATLATGLITSTRELHDEMSEPPPLPPPVRELMRRNNSYAVHDSMGTGIVGGFNPGKTMREVLLT